MTRQVEELRAEVARLEAEVERLRALLHSFDIVCGNEDLRKLLSEAAEALKFYANKKNWDDRWVEWGECEGDVNDVINIEDVDIENVGEEGEPCLTYGGKRAREARAKLTAALGGLGHD